MLGRTLESEGCSFQEVGSCAAVRGLLGLCILVSSLVATGCSDDGTSKGEEFPPWSGTANPTQTPDAAGLPGAFDAALPDANGVPSFDASTGSSDGGSGSPAADSGADAASPTQDGGGLDAAVAPDGGAQSDAGETDGGATDAGDQADGGDQQDAGALDAGGDAESGDSDAGDHVADAGGSHADAGKPTDYREKGPYTVITEKNVGKSFRNNVSDDSLFCNLFIGALGGSNPDVDKELTTYPADMDRGLYTLFRPAELEEGKTYPLLTWGNGTCSHPLLFSELIEHVVSHGFIVIASNSRQVGDGQVMLRAIDYILSENKNSESPLYGKVATDRVGAFGHSQGSYATVTAGADQRIRATVPIMGASASAVRNLKGPTFLIAGEKDDIVDPNGVEDAFKAATVPAVFGLSLDRTISCPGSIPLTSGMA